MWVIILIEKCRKWRKRGTSEIFVLLCQQQMIVLFTELRNQRLEVIGTGWRKSRRKWKKWVQFEACYNGATWDKVQTERVVWPIIQKNENIGNMRRENIWVWWSTFYIFNPNAMKADDWFYRKTLYHGKERTYWPWVARGDYILEGA